MKKSEQNEQSEKVSVDVVEDVVLSITKIRHNMDQVQEMMEENKQLLAKIVCSLRIF